MGLFYMEHYDLFGINVTTIQVNKTTHITKVNERQKLCSDWVLNWLNAILHKIILRNTVRRGTWKAVGLYK